MFNPVPMKMMTTMKRQALKLSKKQKKSTTPGKVRQQHGIENEPTMENTSSGS